MPLCFLKLQIFEVLSVVKKVVLKRHVVRIPFPVNLAVNLRSVHFDQDEGRKQPRKKDVVYLATGSHLKTKILEFGFLLLWTVSWYNFDFGTTFFINYQIVCNYQEHKYRINIRNLSLSGFLSAHFLTLLKKDPVVGC